MSTKSRLTQKKKQKNFMVEIDTKEVKIMKKKWWILNHHSEGNCFYMINATVEEITTLRCLIDNNAEVNENCLYYDYYWGSVEVASPGFATKKECQEYFNTAKEFAFFR